jgi:hypothetical protein
MRRYKPNFVELVFVLGRTDQLKSQLSGDNLSLCARDMLALRQLSNIRACLSHLMSIGFHV